jgi:hypothetical protein
MKKTSEPKMPIPLARKNLPVRINVKRTATGNINNFDAPSLCTVKKEPSFVIHERGFADQQAPVPSTILQSTIPIQEVAPWFDLGPSLLSLSELLPASTATTQTYSAQPSAPPME